MSLLLVSWTAYGYISPLSSTYICEDRWPWPPVLTCIPYIPFVSIYRDIPDIPIYPGISPYIPDIPIYIWGYTLINIEIWVYLGYMGYMLGPEAMASGPNIYKYLTGVRYSHIYIIFGIWSILGYPKAYS